jgi:TRAP-type uncharacterized transport system fused permease subunit
MGVAPCVYLVIDMERLQWEYGSTVPFLDILFSILLMISIMELVRRSFGWAVPLTALGFLAYPVWLFGGLALLLTCGVDFWRSQRHKC